MASLVQRHAQQRAQLEVSVFSTRARWKHALLSALAAFLRVPFSV